jgi:hypothetical protein
VVDCVAALEAVVGAVVGAVVEQAETTMPTAASPARSRIDPVIQLLRSLLVPSVSWPQI